MLRDVLPGKDRPEAEPEDAESSDLPGKSIPNPVRHKVPRPGFGLGRTEVALGFPAGFEWLALNNLPAVRHESNGISCN